MNYKLRKIVSKSNLLLKIAKELLIKDMYASSADKLYSNQHSALEDFEKEVRTAQEKLIHRLN